MLDLFGNDTPTPEEATGLKGAGANRAHSSGQSDQHDSSTVHRESRTTVATAPRESSPAKKEKLPLTPMNEIEKTIVRKLQGHVTFVPASSHKRFIKNLIPETGRLSDRGRNYLAYIANRYRRQWKCTHEEFCWIVQWCRWGKIPEVRREGV
jgi:hypothetical protein